MKRIEAIASLVDKNASVIDIGTDHAYLPIYLYENNITRNITGSDISLNVLEYSLKNLEKHNLDDKINLIHSDGFKNIDETHDIAVISGLGTNTIIDILNTTDKLPNTLILSTHKDIKTLRIYLNKINYKIDKEIVIKENNIYYDIIKYIKGSEALTEKEIYFGKSHNKEYLLYLYDKYKSIPNNKYSKEIELLNKLLA